MVRAALAGGWGIGGRRLRALALISAARAGEPVVTLVETATALPPPDERYSNVVKDLGAAAAASVSWTPRNGLSP